MSDQSTRTDGEKSTDDRVYEFRVRLSPATLTLIGVALTALSSFATVIIQTSFENRSRIELERTKIQSEQEKFQRDLVLRALNLEDHEETVAGLELIANLGFVPTYETKVLEYASDLKDNPDAIIPGNLSTRTSLPTEDFGTTRPSPRLQGPYYDTQNDAAAREAYYKDLDLEAGPAFEALSALLTQTHAPRLPYRTARLEYLYPIVDLRPDSFELRSLYGEAILSGPHNTEAVIPQSWFDRDDAMRGDLHNLFTEDIRCNAFRGILPFGNADLAGPGNTRSNCGKRQADRFAPFENHGVVARAIFYFLVRYPGTVGDQSRELQPDNLEMLKRWHALQPVTLYERHRNAEIQKAQGNRNPFIDFPELAERINLGQGFGHLSVDQPEPQAR